MKIVFVLPVYKPAWGGGVLTAVAPICERLAANGHEVTVYTSSDNGRGGTVDQPTGETKTVNGVNVNYFNFQLPKNVWSKAFHESIDANLPSADIVHVSGMYKLTHESVRFLCRKHDTPYVFSPHGTLSPESIRANNRVVKLALVRTLIKRFLRDAAVVHFTSNNEQTKAESILGTLNGIQTEVIPNGINVEHYSSGDSSSEKINVPPSDPVVLFVGRLVRNKGADIVIEAAGELTEETPHVVLLGPEENSTYAEELRTLAPSVDADVKIKGKVPERELLDWYARADTFVLPSTEENFGMVVAEAAAAGTPAVLTEGVDIHPFVSEYESGVIAERDTDSVRRGIEATLQANPADDARALARSEFALESVTDSFVTLYQSLLD